MTENLAVKDNVTRCPKCGGLWLSIFHVTADGMFLLDCGNPVCRWSGKISSPIVLLYRDTVGDTFVSCRVEAVQLRLPGVYDD